MSQKTDAGTPASKGRSELGIAALLGTAGAVVLIDASRIAAPYSQADPVGPRAMPIIVGCLLLVSAAALAVNVLRGGRGQAEEGEDVDLTHPTDWKTVLPLVGAFILNILLINSAGWVISGTLLFWGSVWALGGRNYIRDGLISVAMALLTFYGFYFGLGIKLPAGILAGIL